MDLDTRLTRIDDKLDRILDVAVTNSRNIAVHSAVCDQDRADLRADAVTIGVAVGRIDMRLWKLLLAMMGSGAIGATAAKALAELL